MFKVETWRKEQNYPPLEEFNEIRGININKITTGKVLEKGVETCS